MLKLIKANESDLTLLRFIAKNQMASKSDINRDIWKDSLPRNNWRRLRRLLKNRWIKPVEGDCGRTLGYTITRKGLNALNHNSKTQYEICTPKRKYRTSFEHDQELRVVRKEIERCKSVVSFRPEHELKQDQKKRSDKVPDAIFALQTHSGLIQVALELELTQKSSSRYIEKYRFFALHEGIQLVLYIVGKETLINSISKSFQEAFDSTPMIRRAPKINGFYFCTLENLKKNGLDAVFCNKNRSFSLHDIAA